MNAPPWLVAIALGATVAHAAMAAGETSAARTAPVAPRSPDASAIPWRTLAKGARSATLADRGIEMLVVQFDLGRYRAEVVVGDGSPPRPQTAGDLRTARKCVAAVNGGFFDDRRAPLGLRITGGKTRVGLRPRVDWGVLVVRDRQARIVHSRDFHPDPVIEQAIQVGPRLIVDGVPLTLKPQAARRTAVALDREGRVLTLVVVDQAIEAGALAARIATIGVDTALLLDGGPSTQMSLEIGGTRIEVPGGYPVPDLLAIFSR